MLMPQLLVLSPAEGGKIKRGRRWRRGREKGLKGKEREGREIKETDKEGEEKKMEKRCEMDSVRGVETLAGEKQKEMIK